MKRKKNEDIEAETRRKVEKKFKERGGLTMHFISYAAVNIMLWIMWLATAQGFPWPMFVTLFWGIGMLSHYVAYDNEYGKGARKREAQIEAEVARQLESAQAQAEYEDWNADDAETFEEATVYELDNFEGRGLRLSDDGELAFLGSAEDDEHLRQSQRQGFGDAK